MKRHYIKLLRDNKEALVTKWAQTEKATTGTSYQTRPLHELLSTCSECFEYYLDILEKGDYSRIRRFLGKIARLRVTLGFKLVEVQRAFLLFKTVVLEFLKKENIKKQESLLIFFEEVDACVNNVIFELSEIYQKKVSEEIEKHLFNIEKMNQQLLNLSITDGLTGLYNHRYFHESLERELKKSQRYKTKFTIIIFDLDDFKKVNDKYGHLCGDEVLREFASVLRGQTREVDMCFRYGGEEFTVILPETDKKGAVKLANRVRKGLKNFVFRFEKDEVVVTVSGGVAIYLGKAGKNKLLDEADAFLYKAKQSGKDRICF